MNPKLSYLSRKIETNKINTTIIGISIIIFFLFLLNYRKKNIKNKEEKKKDIITLVNNINNFYLHN